MEVLTSGRFLCAVDGDSCSGKVFGCDCELHSTIAMDDQACQDRRGYDDGPSSLLVGMSSATAWLYNQTAEWIKRTFTPFLLSGAYLNADSLKMSFTLVGTRS